MPWTFWLRRFAGAFLGALVVLTLVELLKGNDLTTALQFAGTWALIFAGIFVAVGYIRYRRNPSCMLPPRRE